MENSKIENQVNLLKEKYNVSIDCDEEALEFLKEKSFFYSIQQSKFYFSNISYTQFITTKKEQMLKSGEPQYEKYTEFKEKVNYKQSKIQDWYDFYETNVEITHKLNRKILLLEMDLYNYISNVIFQNILNWEEENIINIGKINKKWFKKEKLLINKKKEKYVELKINKPIKITNPCTINMYCKSTEELCSKKIKENIINYVRNLGIGNYGNLINYLHKEELIDKEQPFDNQNLINFFTKNGKFEKSYFNKKMNRLVQIRNCTFHGKLITYNFRDTNDIEISKSIYKSLIPEEYEKHDFDRLIDKGAIYTTWKLSNKKLDKEKKK